MAYTHYPISHCLHKSIQDDDVAGQMITMLGGHYYGNMPGQIWGVLINDWLSPYLVPFCIIE